MVAEGAKQASGGTMQVEGRDARVDKDTAKKSTGSVRLHSHTAETISVSLMKVYQYLSLFLPLVHSNDSYSFIYPCEAGSPPLFSSLFSLHLFLGVFL